MIRLLSLRWAQVCLLLSLVWPGGSPAWAEHTDNEWVVRRWGAGNGLPENTVVGIAQTPDGFLWVATENTLVRFDGVHFREVPFTNAAAIIRGENSGVVVDQQGRLWLIKTRGGAVRISGQEMLSLTPDDGLNVGLTDSFAVDGKDNLWIAVLDSRVVRVQDGAVRQITARDGLPQGSGKCWLVSDSDGTIWFSTQGQVGVWRKDKCVTLLNVPGRKLLMGGGDSSGVYLLDDWTLSRFEEGSPPVELGTLEIDRPDTAVTVLYEDRSGALWIGTRHSGLFRYDEAGFQSVATPSKNILCVTEDREGNIWVGTKGGGLSRLRHRVLELQTVMLNPQPDEVISACQARNGQVFAVTLGGYLMRLGTNGWTRVAGGRAPNLIRHAKCVAADPRGGVWVGTRDDGLLLWDEKIVRRFDRTSGLASPSVRSLLATPSGDIWIGTDVSHVALQRLRGNELEEFSLPAGSGPVSAMAVDDAGDIWAGTTDGSLLRLTGGELINETPNTLLPPRAIQCLSTTPDGSLWIGYAGAGIGSFKAGKFARFGMEEGLPDDYIAQLIPDGRGHLWGIGNSGIFHVAIEDFAAVAAGRRQRVQSVGYGSEDGLENLKASLGYWPRTFQDTNGLLWFSMLTGLLSVNMDSANGNFMPPPVVIERVVVDGQLAARYGFDQLQPVAPGGGLLEMHASKPRLRLTAGNRRAIVEFAALSYVSPGHVGFKYMLDGLDKDWIDAGQERSADLSRLPAGNYQFRVIACNNDGVWNTQGVSLAITVIPPFWKTGWFITLASLTTIVLAAGMVRYYSIRRMRRKLERLQRDHAVELERTRISKDIHDDLGANLTEITLLSELSLDDEVPRHEVQADLRKIAAKARQLTSSIADIVWALNPRHDALDSFISYVCTYADGYLRLARMRCRLEIPEHLPALPLKAAERHNLFLTLKEALNNVVKHSAATEVFIRVTIRPRGFQLMLQDSGRGFDLRTAPESGQANHPGNGLLNMRKRVEDIGGRFELHSEPGQGTRIVLELDRKRK